MTDLSRERLKSWGSCFSTHVLRHQTCTLSPEDMDELVIALDMAEQLLTLQSALGADAQTTTGFGGAMERRPDWTQFDPALHADKDRTEHARPLTTADEDRLKREAAAMALREVAVCLAALNFRPSMMGAHADELEDGR